jgi:hypothetical protein
MFNRAFQGINGGFIGNVAGMQNSFLDRPDLIAADVLIPDINPDGTFKIRPPSPYNPTPDVNTSNIRKNYPQLPDVGVPYRAFGTFGPGTPGVINDASGPIKTPAFIDRGSIRGMMNFVPGGIPASPGFNYDATLKNYPEEMKGIKRGKMPVYYSPF